MVIEKPNLRDIKKIGGSSKRHVLKGWKYAAFVGSIVGFIGITIYPIIIDPMLNPEKYKKQQAVNRKDIDQASVQPGNMRIWSDPFKPREEDH